MDKRIIIGADPFGFTLKESVKDYLIKQGYDVKDVGTLSETEPVDYYIVGYKVGKAIAEKEYEKGLLFCGTGMGVNIVANKFPGVYCGLCESVQATELCRMINNCNVLSMGGIFNAPYKAIKMVEAFLKTKFTVGFPEADPKFLEDAYYKIGELEKKIITEYSKKIL